MPRGGRNKLDLNGAVFGRWTVIQQAPDKVHPSGYRATYWLCRCDCGTEREVFRGNLLAGRTVSCGCYGQALLGEASRKHGASCSNGGKRSPEYSCWIAMRQRCRDPGYADYHRYGGRGITICSEWDDFAAFYADMGPRPSKGHSLDRIDNGGNYEPGNCRWATRAEQAQNRRPRGTASRMAFETALNADATLTTAGDALTVTETVTLS